MHVNLIKTKNCFQLKEIFSIFLAKKKKNCATNLVIETEILKFPKLVRCSGRPTMTSGRLVPPPSFFLGLSASILLRTFCTKFKNISLITSSPLDSLCFHTSRGLIQKKKKRLEEGFSLRVFFKYLKG